MRSPTLRRLAMVLATVFLFLTTGPAPHADPFTGGRPPADSSEAGPSGGGFVLWLASRQHQLNEAISDAFHDVEENHSRTAFALILGLAFLYGMLHAIGPGHGKSVVASYFVAHHARWTSGIVMGSMISLIQGVTAIVLVGVLAAVLQWKQFDILGRSTLIEFISYGLIAAIGVVMFYRAATGKLHHHDHGAHDHDHSDHDHAVAAPRRGPARLDRRLIVATGLTPCASAIIILLFALANDALGIGVIAVAALSIGMAVTISVIGVLTVLGRRVLLRMIDAVGVKSHRIEERLAMLGAFVIVAVSGLMMYDSWLRL